MYIKERRLEFFLYFSVLKARLHLRYTVVAVYGKGLLFWRTKWILRAEHINHAVLPGSQHKGEPPECVLISLNLRQVSERTKSKLIHEAMCVRRLFVFTTWGLKHTWTGRNWLLSTYHGGDWFVQCWHHSKPLKFRVMLNNRSKVKILNAVDIIRLDYFVYTEE